MTLGTYYRTARRTHWSQLLWRARDTLERRRRVPPRSLAGWRWPGSGTPPRRGDFPEVPLFHRPPPGGAAGSGGGPPEWRLGRVAVDRLGTITLHYHAWAYGLAESAGAGGEGADEAAALFRDHVGDWMRRCPLDARGARDLAWNSYAIATRIGWWVRAACVLGPDRLG